MSRHLPLRPLQVALYNRLTTHEAMSEHTIRRKNTSPNYPYVALVTVNFTDASTDTNYATEMIAQVDTYALMANAGDKVAADMLDDTLVAITDSKLEVDAFDDTITHEPSSGSLAQDRDRETGQLLARGILNYRFTVYQS